MALQQSIEQARPKDFEAALARTTDALSQLRARHADGTLALLRLSEKTDDVATILGYATLLRDGTTDVVFLGTGGSSLGGQTLAQLGGYGVAGVGLLRDPPRIHFMDNLDPDSYAALLQRLPLRTARFVAVSKSGGTGETLMQSIAALDALKRAGRDPYDHMLGVTEPERPGKANGLRALLGAHRIRMIDHDPSVGGRYSVLTNVGLLPAAVCGLDIGAIRSGAADALAPVLADKPPAEVPPAVGAALAAALAGSKPLSVMMAYADRLERFTHWYVQLWAESLGKNGKGTTPLAALGPVDQHSQLQLFMAGPRDKLFTVVTVKPQGRGPRLDSDLAKLAGEPDFGGRTIGDLVAAQGRATAETLARNDCPVRTIELDRLDERHLGALLMHFMLETIIAAHLIGVDPFDQPAVEEGKVLAKRYLKDSPRG
jgi:glucose-6-phosphate isomerase